MNQKAHGCAALAFARLQHYKGRMRHFPNFSSLQAYLDRLGHFRINPDMDRITKVLQRLGLVHLPFSMVQVAGTNGKGSTSTMLASVCQAHGLKTGLYTSPHFVSFRERARIDGAMLPDDDWLEQAEALMRNGGETLTYFEFLTVLSAMLFASNGVDAAVMETGLGGTWDGVSAFEADLVAFTPISLDHCHILGDTVEAIARDKAGAIRPGKPVITAPQSPDALAVLRETAAERNSVLLVSSRQDLPPAILQAPQTMALRGEHQLDNAALALAAWQELALSQGWQRSADAEVHGLRTAAIAGRFQYLPPFPERGLPALLLDGAHNVDGLSALGRELARQGISPAAVIFACLEDKNPELVAAHLRVLSTGPIFVPPIPDNPRSLPPKILAARIGLAAKPVESMAQALSLAAAHVQDYLPQQAKQAPCRHPVLICGSLYLLGEFYSQWPDCLENPSGPECGHA